MTRHLTELASLLLACIVVGTGPALGGRPLQPVVRRPRRRHLCGTSGRRAFSGRHRGQSRKRRHLRRHVRWRNAEQAAALRPAWAPRRSARLRHCAAARPGVRSRQQQGLHRQRRRLRRHRLQDPAHCGGPGPSDPPGRRRDPGDRRARAAHGGQSGRQPGHDHVRFRRPCAERDGLRQPRESVRVRLVPGRDLQDRQPGGLRARLQGADVQSRPAARHRRLPAVRRQRARLQRGRIGAVHRQYGR